MGLRGGEGLGDGVFGIGGDKLGGRRGNGGDEGGGRRGVRMGRREVALWELIL